MTTLTNLCLLMSIFTSAFFAQPAIAAPENNESSDVTCKEALQNAGRIKVGMSDTEVLSLLGKPIEVEKGEWIYSFWECRPPIRPGSQIIIGLAMTFNDKAITKVDYATMCATGPGN